MHIFDAYTGEAVKTVRSPVARVWTLAWLDDPRTLVIAAASGQLWLFDPVTGDFESVRGHTAPVTTIEPLGADRAVTTGRDGETRWWSFRDRSTSAEYVHHATSSFMMGIAAVGEEFWAAAYNGEAGIATTR